MGLRIRLTKIQGGSFSSGQNEISQARGRNTFEDHKINIGVRQELCIIGVPYRTGQYWPILEHLNHMDDFCLPKSIGVGSFKRCWIDQL